MERRKGRKGRGGWEESCDEEGGGLKEFKRDGDPREEKERAKEFQFEIGVLTKSAASSRRGREGRMKRGKRGRER